MKLFTTQATRLLDQTAVEYESITSLDLMERAAKAIANEIARTISPDHRIFIFAGPGNNGGDALATARLLIKQGYRPITYLFNTLASRHLSSNCEVNRRRLNEVCPTDFQEVTGQSRQFIPPKLADGDVIIDGLFGTGLKEPVEGGFAALIRFINDSKAFVISLDIPSGLYSEWNLHNLDERIVRANLTLTLQSPKLSFFFAENEKFIGKVRVLDLNLHPRAIADTETPYYLTTENDVAQRLRTRNRFSSKHDYGHLLLAAGQYAMTGAAVLSARAALHCGTGLVTTHAPRCSHLILQTAVPEAIYSPDKGENHIEQIPVHPRYTAVAVGPGMGCNETTFAAFTHLIQEVKQPLLLDADALNCIAQDPSVLRTLPANTILTPHVYEFERIFGAENSDENRFKNLTYIAKKYDLIIVLKGRYTAVALPDGTVHLNPSGNPGMATAGSGDALTGVIGGLLAQGYAPAEAAIIGVYLHGVAGDLAAQDDGEEYITAGDIIAHLGKAFQQIKSRQG